jgi:hypothetical protein
MGIQLFWILCVALAAWPLSAQKKAICGSFD